MQNIDALDSVIFDCSQLTGATGPIQIPVSIKSDDLIYAVDFSLKYDHSALQYDTTINVTSYLQGLSNYNSIDSTIRFTSSTFTPCTNDTALALIKFILLAPSFNNGTIFTLKGYLNGTLCSTKYIPPSPVGLSDISIQENTKLYPNPCKSEFNLEFDDVDIMEICELTGNIVYAENVINKSKIEIRTSSFKNGVYFVKLKKAERIITRKLIINN